MDHPGQDKLTLSPRGLLTSLPANHVLKRSHELDISEREYRWNASNSISATEGMVHTLQVHMQGVTAILASSRTKIYPNKTEKSHTIFYRSCGF